MDTIDRLTVDPETLKVVDNKGRPYHGSLVHITSLEFSVPASLWNARITEYAHETGADAYLVIGMANRIGCCSFVKEADWEKNPVVLDSRVGFYKADAPTDP